MLAVDVRIEHVRPEELSALVRFLTEPPVGARIGDLRRGLIVVLRDRVPVALVDLCHGVVPLPAWLPRDRAVDAVALRRLRRERDATWALAAGAALLERLDEAICRAYDPSADLVRSLLPLAAVFREARRAGEALFSPALLDEIPIPPESAVRAAFDLVLPDDHSALLYAFGPRGLSFSLLAEKRRGAIVRIAGHDALGGIPVRGAQWRAAVPRILRETAYRLAPPAVGVFGDEAALRRVVFGTEPAALPRALAARNIILDPLPPWLALLLGADTAAKAASTATDLLRRLDPLGLARRLDVGHLAGELRRRLGGEHPLARILGFDPLALLERFRRWDEL